MVFCTRLLKIAPFNCIVLHATACIRGQREQTQMISNKILAYHAPGIRTLIYNVMELMTMHSDSRSQFNVCLFCSLSCSRLRRKDIMPFKYIPDAPYIL